MAYRASPPTKDVPDPQKDMPELGLRDRVQQSVPVHVGSEGAVKVHIYDGAEGAS